MTVQEVEAKKTQLEVKMSTALEAAKVLTPATSEFDEAYGIYLACKTDLAKIPDELAKAKVSENAEAIKTASVTVGEAIAQLVSGLEIEELLGAPVKSLRYAVDADGKAIVIFNPITKVASTGKAPKEAKGAGHTAIIAPDGTKLSLTKFVIAHATDEEKASPEFKYPHTRVDSRPKFEAFCEAHSLTGYTYEIPGKAPEAS